MFGIGGSIKLCETTHVAWSATHTGKRDFQTSNQGIGIFDVAFQICHQSGAVSTIAVWGGTAIGAEHAWTSVLHNGRSQRATISIHLPSPFGTRKGQTVE